MKSQLFAGWIDVQRCRKWFWIEQFLHRLCRFVWRHPSANHYWWMNFSAKEQRFVSAMVTHLLKIQLFLGRTNVQRYLKWFWIELFFCIIWIPTSKRAKHYWWTNFSASGTRFESAIVTLSKICVAQLDKSKNTFQYICNCKKLLLIKWFPKKFGFPVMEKVLQLDYAWWKLAATSTNGKVRFFPTTKPCQNAIFLVGKLRLCYVLMWVKAS